MTDLANFLAQTIRRNTPNNLCTVIDGKKYIKCSWAKLNLAMVYFAIHHTIKSKHETYIQYADYVRQSTKHISDHNMKQHVIKVWEHYDSLMSPVHAAHALIQLSSQNTACAF